MYKIFVFIIFNIIFSAMLNAGNIIKKNGTVAFYDDKGNLIKLKEDTNHDKKADIIKFIKNGKVYKIKQDKDFDGYFETEIFNNKILLDSNKDGKVDKEFIYKNGKLTLVKIDSDFNGKFDTFKYYKNGKLIKEFSKLRKVFYLKKNEKKIIQNENEFYYKNDKIIKAIIKKKGKTYRIVYFKNGLKFKEKIDRNLDGFFEIFVKYHNGKVTEKELLKKNCKCPVSIDKNDEILFDKNCNGIFEKIIKVKGNSKIVYLDNNEDKVPDVVLKYKEKNLVSVRKKGEKIFYKNGKIVKIEKDTNSDGKVDLIEYYKKGVLIKVKKDLNFDGKFDFEN